MCILFSHLLLLFHCLYILIFNINILPSHFGNLEFNCLFTIYTLHSTLYTLHSTLYTLHSTLYIDHIGYRDQGFKINDIHTKSSDLCLSEIIKRYINSFYILFIYKKYLKDEKNDITNWRYVTTSYKTKF